MGGSVSTKEKNIPGYDKQWAVKLPPVNTVTGTMAQTVAYGKYNPECHQCNGEGCDFGECSAATSWFKCNEGSAAKMTDATGTVYTPEGQDQTSYFQNCFCSTKPICTRPNIEQCWLGPSSKGEEPTYRADWDGDKLKCTYDADRIDTVKQLINYSEKYRTPHPPSYNLLMTKWCSQKSDKCYVDPTTGTKADQCSYVASTGPEAQVCRYWYENLSAQDRDSFIDIYCGQNPDAVECKCVLRGQNKEYQTIKNKYITPGVEDACIFVPCKGASPAFFVPSADRNPKCPSTLCQTVYNASATGNVTIQNNQSYLTCQPPRADQKPVPPYVPPIPLPPASPPTSSSFNYWWLLIGVLVLLCLFIMVRY